MNIDEAIKLLGSLQGETPEQLATPMQHSIKLGIEALKRVQQNREDGWYTSWKELPGETKE